MGGGQTGREWGERHAENEGLIAGELHAGEKQVGKSWQMVRSKLGVESR